MIRFAAVVAASLLGLGATAYAIGALIDQPSRTYRDAVVVSAPRAVIWDMLTNFERYEEWNPYLTRGSGMAIVGSNVELVFRTDPGDAETKVATILIMHPQRKLEWRTRVIAPGILDREQIFRVLPLDSGRWRVVQEVRFEGLLALFADVDEDRAGLVDMLDAIAELAPHYQSSRRRRRRAPHQRCPRELARPGRAKAAASRTRHWRGCSAERHVTVEARPGFPRRCFRRFGGECGRRA